MRIHCINLERATERREQILKNWADYDVEFFNGVDRRTLSNNNYDKSKSIELLGRPLTDGEIACSLSHINLLKQLLDGNDDFFIVIEDDAKPLVSPDQFHYGISLMKNFSKGDEIFIIFKPYVYNNHSFKRKDGEFLYLTGEKLWGTCGMFYTRAGAELMLKCLEKMTLPADCYWSEIGEQDRLLKYNLSLIEHIGTETTYIEKTYRGEIEQPKIFLE